MNVVDAIKSVQKFLEDNVVCNVSYLKPSKKDGKDYDFQYVNPTVWPMYLPSDDRSGGEISSPSVIVKFQKTSEEIEKLQSNIIIQLEFNIWRPGSYIEESKPEQKGITVTSTGASVEYQENVIKNFQRDASGWVDLWGFIDYTKSILFEKGLIGNYQLDLHQKIESGPFTQDGAIVDFHPYYFGWLTFGLKSLSTPISKDIDEFL